MRNYAMNELQKTELEILRAFIGVCEKLDLQYYMVCGSALGAVKYGGFIPWDDDVDVALPREDYNIFIDRAQALLPTHYFVQTYRTDPKFPAFFCKVRDSRTTYIEKSMQYRKMNHGVFIDVFPLDGYPADQTEAERLERRKRVLKRRLDCANAFQKGQKPLTRAYFILERIMGCHRRSAKYAAALDRLVAARPTEDSRLWCNHGNWQGKKEYAPREQYGEGTTARFEDLNVIIPENYDAYLTQKYGDWRADLSESEKTGHHYTAVCDTTCPYTSYF